MSDFDDLREELERLRNDFERQRKAQANRTLRSFVGGTVTAFVVGIAAQQVAGQPQAGILKAPFVVTDARGRTVFQVGEDFVDIVPRYAVNVTSAEGSDSMSIGINKDTGTTGWGLTVFRKKDMVAYLGSTGDGSGQVDARNGASGSIASIGGTRGFTIRANDVMRAQIGPNEQGRVGARIFNEQGMPQIIAESGASGGVLTATHTAGRVAIGVNPGGTSPGVRIFDGGGAAKIDVGVRNGSGGMHAGSSAGGWAELAVAPSGGYVAVSKIGGSATGLSALSRDQSGGPSMVELSSRNGRSALRIYNPQNVQVAALGESPETAGSGALRIFNSAGQPQVSLDSLAGGGALNVFANSSKAPIAAVTADAKSGTGIVAVYNNAGSALGALAQGVNGGILQLSDSTGTPMVEAGTSSGGVGLVRTGPMPRAMLPGIPGSYILGKK